MMRFVLTSTLTMFFLLVAFATCSAEKAVPPPHRIISLMPSLTELVFALGFGKRVVGVSDYCNYPPEVASIPRVGGMELNLERIVGLQPDLIIDLDEAHARYANTLRGLGIPMQNYKERRLDEIASTAVAISRDFGESASGEAFANSWSLGMASATGCDIVSKNACRVYIEVWDSPLQAAGRETFIDDILKAAGGVNIIETGKTTFPLLDAETVINGNPDLILLAYPSKDPGAVARRTGWENLHAVRNGGIRVIDPDIFTRPGPRCLKAIRELKRLLATCPTHEDIASSTP
ncbi:MAG: ABC transporter substrate-binding protein [Candidatus Riflebacteria bacterium]|nr:ABC transporter substrate-binding protein [Candidatus Riflebacteria bacterium]